MNRIIVCVALLVTNCLVITNAEKFVFVVPTRQIRRSPTLPLSVRPNVRLATPYLKYPTFGTYGLTRPSLPNQLTHGIGDYERAQNSISHAITPYGKGIYAPYSRGYLPYDKKGGGLVPFVNQQSRYPLEPPRPRLPPGPVYSPTSVPNGYYHRLVNNDPYVTDKNLPTRPQPSDRPIIHSPFIGNQRSPTEEQTVSQNYVPQPAASSNYPKVGPIIVTPSSVGNSQYQEASRTGDLTKESSNAVSKVPPASAIGAGKGGIVLRDTILLGDYEKKIAEFTKSWPKLSAFPGAFGDASSYFPGSSLNPSLSSGLARSSDSIGISNSIGRQGYAVKEDIDEPPFDFINNPINTSPLHAYPTPTSEFYRHFG